MELGLWFQVQFFNPDCQLATHSTHLYFSKISIPVLAPHLITTGNWSGSSRNKTKLQFLFQLQSSSSSVLTNWNRWQFLLAKVDTCPTLLWTTTGDVASALTENQRFPSEYIDPKKRTQRNPGSLPSLAPRQSREVPSSLTLSLPSLSRSLSLSLTVLAICRFWAAFCVRLCGAVGALHGDLSFWALPLFFWALKIAFSICSTKASLPAASAVFCDHCSTYTECLERFARVVGHRGAWTQRWVAGFTYKLLDRLHQTFAVSTGPKLLGELLQEAGVWRTLVLMHDADL